MIAPAEFMSKLTERQYSVYRGDSRIIVRGVYPEMSRSYRPLEYFCLRRHEKKLDKKPDIYVGKDMSKETGHFVDVYG